MPSEAYTAAREKIRAAKEEAQRLASEAFETEALALVKELGIKSFSWTQYTPYFNDGDACVFSVGSDYPMINGFDEYGDGDEDVEDEDGNPVPPPERPEWKSRAEQESMTPAELADYEAKQEAFRAPFKQIASFLAGWEDEDMLFMFGDHAQVTVTKDGITVDEYSHD